MQPSSAHNIEKEGEAGSRLVHLYLLPSTYLKRFICTSNYQSVWIRIIFSDFKFGVDGKLKLNWDLQVRTKLSKYIAFSLYLVRFYRNMNIARFPCSWFLKVANGSRQTENASRTRRWHNIGQRSYAKLCSIDMLILCEHVPMFLQY